MLPASQTVPTTAPTVNDAGDVTTISFARMDNDNPDRENLDDKLGVEDEANAFARIAAARQVDPPLAFGIFGDWGSGKSFFMRLMQEHVEKLAGKTADEAKTDLFHENIVQIRFNAWHYVETNLWASLVDYIFFQLDRWVLTKLNSTQQNTVFDKLATARDLTLESAERLVRRRKDQKAAAGRLASAERELLAAREKVGGTPRLFWEVVLTNFERLVSKKDLEKTAATLGLDQLANDAELLKEALDSLEAEGQRAKVDEWHSRPAARRTFADLHLGRNHPRAARFELVARDGHSKRRPLFKPDGVLREHQCGRPGRGGRARLCCRVRRCHYEKGPFGGCDARRLS